MVISYNSQLGLRFSDKKIKSECLTIQMKYLESKLDGLNKVIEIAQKDLKDLLHDELVLYNDLVNDFSSRIQQKEDNDETAKMADDKIDLMDLLSDDGTSYYYICDSVYKAAALIKIGEKFTGRTLKDINFGKYTYLMGKHRMIRFVCAFDIIKGIYYDELNKKAFQFAIDIDNGNYSFHKDFDLEFSMAMQIMAFVELGDIEILELQGGKNNGGKKNEDKITNTSKNTVYVVDSSWNKIIIRTTGFAVRGHYRLQPCGEGMIDRKLIWISAFEKSGYKRSPKAEIVR
jgi:hypothetical protein